MISKNNHKLIEQRNAERIQQRWTLRKYSIGVASVLLGTTMFLGSSAVAHADTAGSATVSTETEQVAKQDGQQNNQQVVVLNSGAQSDHTATTQPASGAANAQSENEHQANSAQSTVSDVQVNGSQNSQVQPANGAQTNIEPAQSVSSISAQSATDEQSQPTISERSEDQQITYNFIDTEENNANVGEPIKVTSSNDKIVLPYKYTLADGETLPTEYDFNSDNGKTFNIRLKHLTEQVSRKKQITRTINYVDENGHKLTNSVTQTSKTLIQYGSKDVVTHNITWDDWNFIDSDSTSHLPIFDSFEIPRKPGYHPVITDNNYQSTINGKSVTTIPRSGITVDKNGNPVSTTIDVYYQSDEEPFLETKTVTRDIYIQAGSKPIKVATQYVTLHRTNTKNILTGEIRLGVWSGGTFPAFKAPKLVGYSAMNPDGAGAITVGNSKDLINDGKYSALLYYYNSSHSDNTEIVSQSKTVTRDIYTQIEGQNTRKKVTTQEVTVYRIGVKNLTTGEITWNDWQTCNMPSYLAPTMAGYTVINSDAGAAITVDGSETQLQDVVFEYQVNTATKQSMNLMQENDDTVDPDKKSITRTIIIHNLDGTIKRTIVQTINFEKLPSTTTDTLAAVDNPDIKGYQTKDTQVPAVDVNIDFDDSTINVVYNAIDQTATYQFVDPQGNVVGTYTAPTGKTGTAVDIDQDKFNQAVPDHYYFADDDYEVPSTFTYTAEDVNPVIKVNVKKAAIYNIAFYDDTENNEFSHASWDGVDNTTHRLVGSIDDLNQWIQQQAKVIQYNGYDLNDPELSKYPVSADLVSAVPSINELPETDVNTVVHFKHHMYESDGEIPLWQAPNVQLTKEGMEALLNAFNGTHKVDNGDGTFTDQPNVQIWEGLRTFTTSPYFRSLLPQIFKNAKWTSGGLVISGGYSSDGSPDDPYQSAGQDWNIFITNGSGSNILSPVYQRPMMYVNYKDYTNAFYLTDEDYQNILKEFGLKNGDGFSYATSALVGRLPMLKYHGTIDGFYVGRENGKYTLPGYDNIHITSNNSSDKINGATIPDGYKAQILVPIMNQDDGTVQYKLVTVDSNELQKETTIGNQTDLYYSDAGTTLNDRIAQSGIYGALHQNSDGTYTWQFSHDGAEYNGFNGLKDAWSDVPGFIKKVYSPMYTEAIAKALQESGMAYDNLSGYDAAFPLTMLYTLVPEEQSVLVNYIDDTTHRVLKTDTLTGNTGSSVDINVQVPEHYVLKAGQNIPASYTFTAHNEPINILVIPKIDDITDANELNSQVTRKIIIHEPGKTPQVINQVAKFTRTGTINEVTGEKTYTDWQLTDNGLQEVISPIVAGYTASQDKVNQINNPAESDQFDDINITYTANEQQIHVVYKDGEQTIKSTSLNGHTDETVNVVLDVPTNYRVTNAQDVPNSYTFKATDNHDIIVELTHNTESATDTKTITRTINVTSPNGATKTTKQTVTLHRDGTKDLVTGNTEWQNWSTGTWDAYDVPTIAGYTPTQASVEQQTVTSETTDAIVDITYTANKQQIHVVYKDGEQTIKSMPLNGHTDETVNVILDVPTNYRVTNAQDVPNSYTFKATDNHDIIVELTHNTESATDTKTITRTINVTNPDGATKTTKQTVTLNRQGTKDLVTGDTKWQDWSTGTWNAYGVPTIDGYTPTQATVEQQTVTDETTDATVNITYTADEQSINIVYKDGNQTIKTTPLNGRTDETIDVDLDVPANYHVTNNVPKKYTFKANGNEDIIVKLAHNTQPATDTKTITRTINVTSPDGITKITKQIATLHRQGTKDLVTNDINWGAWSTDAWAKFDVPTIAGYTPTQVSVASQIVTSDTKDTIVNISYVANEQHANIIYKDGDQIIKTTPITGKTGQTISIKLEVPEHYHVNNEVPSDYTFQAENNNDVIVELGHDTHNVSDTKSVVRTIKVTNPDNETNVIKQTATISRQGIKDLVTGDTDWQDWSTDTWNTYNVPTIEGYTPSQSVVSAQTVDSNTQPVTIEITYTADTQHVKVIYQTPDGEPVQTNTLTGKTNETVPVPGVPANYHAIDPVPSDVVMKPGMSDIVITVEPNMTPVRDSKSVVRTINITDPDGTTRTIKQKADLVRTGMTNEVTGKTDWDSWSESHWDAYDTPVIEGYTANIANVPYQIVDGNSESTVINIHYVANEQTTHVVYKDGNETIKTDTLTGKTGQTVHVVPQVPAGYHIVSQSASDYTFKATDNQNIIIQVAKNHIDTPTDNQNDNGQPQTPTNDNEQPQTPISDNQQQSVKVTPNVSTNTNSTQNTSQQKLPQTGNEEDEHAKLGIFLSSLGLSMIGGLLLKKRHNKEKD